MKKKSKFQNLITLICYSYWIINSILGVYILLSFPSLNTTHPNLYLYLFVFSGKWIIAFFASLLLLLISCIILKICCHAQDVFSHIIGVFPIMYLIVIITCYFYALYYGIIMLFEIYSPIENDD